MPEIEADPPLFMPGEQRQVEQSQLAAPPDPSRPPPTNSFLTRTGYLVRDREQRRADTAGVDWSTRTVREAQAARLSVTTLCSDGIFVPGI